MKTQLKKYFPLTLMLLLLVLVVSMMPQEGAADKANALVVPTEQTLNITTENKHPVL